MTRTLETLDDYVASTYLKDYVALNSNGWHAYYASARAFTDSPEFFLTIPSAALARDTIAGLLQHKYPDQYAVDVWDVEVWNSATHYVNMYHEIGPTFELSSVEVVQRAWYELHELHTVPEPSSWLLAVGIFVVLFTLGVKKWVK